LGQPLAAELNSAALSYDKVITTLSSDEWVGPASASMAQAAEPYVAWMTTTTAKAEQAAAQARAAAAAYETALAATVPVPLVAANRAELTQLVSTNVLGQNTSAIAANEAQYGEMWAQDATAMYGYAGQSAAATKVSAFSAAPQVASPTAQATQAAATTSATATSAGTAQSMLSELVSSLPNQLQSLASPAATTSATRPTRYSPNSGTCSADSPRCPPTSTR
jgi:PPE-repeat protein